MGEDIESRLREINNPLCEEVADMITFLRQRAKAAEAERARYESAYTEAAGRVDDRDAAVKRAEAVEVRAMRAERALWPFAIYAAWMLDNRLSTKIAENDTTPVLGGDGYEGQPEVWVADLKRARDVFAGEPPANQRAETDAATRPTCCREARANAFDEAANQSGLYLEICPSTGEWTGRASTVPIPNAPNVQKYVRARDIRALKPDGGDADTEHRATVAVEPEGDTWCVKRDGVVVLRKFRSQADAHEMACKIARGERIPLGTTDADGTEGA